jgi:DNA-binding transcriptional ArsR family regulator
MGATVDLLASALFGKTRRAVLALLFAEPDRSFFLREIVRRIGTGQGSVHRELRRLSDADIIRRDDSGRVILYRVNRDSPVYEDLRSLIAKTGGAAEELRRALEPLRNRIDVAFIYGSFARSTGLRRASDIDVMVVGDVTFGETVEHTASAQERLAREVNPTVYSRAEFVKRVREGHHFVRDVLQRPKVFLVGGPREFERLAQGRVAHTPQADARRNPSAPRRSRPRSKG